MLKILFINAIDTTKEIQTKYPPLGIGHLISALRERYPDQIEFEVVDHDIVNALNEFRPDIVGISAVSQNYNRAIEYASIIRKYGLLVICGGVHISMMPNSLSKDMGIGVIGEGEETICELIGMYLKGDTFIPESLKSVKGIVYHYKGQIVATDKREPIKWLDSLPLPDRTFFPVKQNTYMFTSRGCPFKCVFCSSTRFWKGVRCFSPDYIANEIQQLIKQGVNDISFYDDIFPLNTKRIKKLISVLRHRGILGKVDFHCSIRANMVNDEIIIALKEMGTISIGLGFESGCERILQYLKGQSVTLKDNINAVKTIKRHGLEISGSFIIGSPNETMQEIKKTYEFIKHNKFTSFCVYPLTPLPGTPIWDYALSKGLVSENMDWSKLDVEHGRLDSIIMSKNLTRKQLDKLFSMFEKLRIRRLFLRLIKVALKHPDRIPGFIYRKRRSVIQITSDRVMGLICIVISAIVIILFFTSIEW